MYVRGVWLGLHEVLAGTIGAPHVQVHLTSALPSRAQKLIRCLNVLPVAVINLMNMVSL